MKAFVLLLALGFALAVFIAWAFEMTPEGMKRTEDLSPDEVISQWSRRKFAALFARAGVLAPDFQFAGHPIGFYFSRDRLVEIENTNWSAISFASFASLARMLLAMFRSWERSRNLTSREIQ
jgi:hypothetical protein